MGGIGKMGKDALGASNSDQIFPSLVENALQGDSQALQELLVKCEEPLKELASNDGVTKATDIKSFVKETKELAENRIQKASIPDRESKEDEGEENKLPLGYPRENPNSPESFFKWLKVCYFDIRIYRLQESILQNEKQMSQNRLESEHELRKVFSNFYEACQGLIRKRKIRDFGYKGPEDVVQETFETVWEKLVSSDGTASKFDPEAGTFSTWIYSIAKTKEKAALSRDKHREEKRKRIIEHYRELMDDGKQEALVKFRAYLNLLNIICQHTRYPHKQFAYLFSIIIFGELTEADEIQGDPQRVVSEYSHIFFDGPSGETVESLFQSFKVAFCHTTRVIDVYELFEHCKILEHLRSKLYVSVRENVKFNRRNLRTFESFLDEPTALTTLFHYLNCYNEEHSKKISEWCYELKNEVKTILKLSVK